jgi:hypothetical protein
MEVSSYTYTNCKNSTSVLATFVQPAEHNFIAYFESILVVCKFQPGMIFEQSVTVDPRLLPETSAIGRTWSNGIV